MSDKKRIIELLCPARDYNAAVAAIDCGADALYIGASSFGARRGATNSTEDIARVVAYAHLFGVRVYVTLNTILYESELRDAERLALRLIECGVDGLIVQDMAYRHQDLMNRSIQNRLLKGIWRLTKCTNSNGKEYFVYV